MKLAAMLMLALACCEAQQPAPPPIKAEIGKPFTIDGIEIVLTDVRIGGVADGKPAADALPEAQFLKVNFKLRNTTESKIVTIQDPWNSTRLKDEHGNFYKAQNVSLGELRTSQLNTKLRPGADASGVIFFEVPLKVAKEVKILIEPGFYRDNGDGTLDDLSKDSAQCEIENPAAE